MVSSKDPTLKWFMKKHFELNLFLIERKQG